MNDGPQAIIHDANCTMKQRIIGRNCISLIVLNFEVSLFESVRQNVKCQCAARFAQRIRLPSPPCPALQIGEDMSERLANENL